MRFLILIALCLAVASANYANKQRFNRLLRQLQQQQDQEQGYGTQGYYQEDDDQDQDQDDEQEKYYGQRQQRQCSRNQRGSMNLDDDENEYDSSEQDDEDQQDQYQGQNQGQNQGQRRHHQRRQQQNQYQNQYQQQNQQQRRRQQQKQQCTPKFQLLQDLEQVNSQLAAKLYKQAKQENDDKNTVVGPCAVQLALAAIKRGARGNTKRQIQRVIGAGMSQKQSQQAHAALQQSLQGQDPLQKQTGENQKAKIKQTTTIIINQRSRAQQKFIQAAQACLNAQVKKCDFQRQPQQCRQQINRHVAQKTNHKLQQTVPQDAITENTKLVVVNTAQLKAKWGQQFRNQQQTKQGRFYPLGSKQSKHVQMLQSQGQFNYYEDNQMQVVGVPTQREELTLYVIVPKDKDGLNQIEKQQIQNGQQLKQLLENADQQKEQIDIELPKFQIKHKIDAKRTLRQQGAQDAFDADEADLSGINGQQQQDQQEQRRRHHQQQRDSDEDDQQDQDQDQQQRRQQQLHVNKLIHQATIKIDEQGISAAKPRNQRQQQDQDQDQDQDEQNQYQQDDEDDEQQDQYEQRQMSRQELEEEIFGQRQGRQGRRHHQRRQQQSRRQHGRRQQDQDQDEDQYQGQAERRVKVNRAFAFAVKHNPSNQIVLVGRVVDATQKPKNHQRQGRQQRGQQSLNGVDQQ